MRPQAGGTVFSYMDRSKPVNNVFICSAFFFFLKMNQGKLVCKKSFYALYVALSQKALRSQRSEKNDRLTIKQNFKYLLVQ